MGKETFIMLITIHEITVTKINITKISPNIHTTRFTGHRTTTITNRNIKTYRNREQLRRIPTLRLLCIAS